MKQVLFAFVAVIIFAGWIPESSTKKGGRPFVVMMSGLEEVTVCDPDATGVARFWLNQGQGTIEYELMVEGVSAPIFGAHIHRGAVGDAGDIVVHLAAPVTGYSSGVTQVDPGLIKEIRQNPEAFYVNVHSTACGPGAVRGQLSK